MEIINIVENKNKEENKSENKKKNKKEKYSFIKNNRHFVHSEIVF